MLRSLFSGISGLRAHQQMMDVVGNNIANVNTVGYKSSSTVFEDTLSQVLKGAGAPQPGIGGTNPAQVGLGVRLAAINTNFGQGAAQTSGRATDLMIQGDGFFMVKNGSEDLYTRAGAFTFDTNGTLVTPEGAIVQGWAADASGAINSNSSVTGITLPMATLQAPKATKGLDLAGNLPADATEYTAAVVPPATPKAESGTKIVTSIVTYDGQGKKYNVSFELTAKAPAAAGGQVTDWDIQAFGADATGKPVSLGAAFTAKFDPATGKFADPKAVAMTYTPIGDGWGTTPTPITVDLAGLTEFGGDKSVAVAYHGTDGGSAMGSLQSFTMSPDGTLVGVFSNGLKQPLAQIAMANFNNPPGLEKVGGSAYRTTVNSGTAQLGTAGSGGRGTLVSGALEMSNVDLAQEFTSLIVAQRGFQANSKVITASDEILTDLVNLKR